MSNIKLSVIIPAYNEEKNLKSNVLEQVWEYLKKVDYTYEVIVVDDGSVDKTAEILEEQIKGKKNFRLIKNEHGGKALTVMKGLMEAQGEIGLFTDMDQATPLKEVEKLFPKFEEGNDIVIGSRNGRKGAPFMRKLAAFGFATLRNIILGLPFSDTQCGFKAFNTKARKSIFPRMEGEWKNMKNKGAAVNAGFDVELLFLAKKQGFKIADVPVDWHHVGSERVHLVKDSIDALKDMFRVRLNDLAGKYA